MDLSMNEIMTDSLFEEEAEQSILGCMLLDKESISTSLNHLSAEDFYREQHQHIFSLIKNMNEKGKPVDVITVTAEAKDNGGLERCGSIVYITDLINSIPTTANLQNYIDIVKEKSKKREDVKIREQLVKDIQEGHPLNEILSVYSKVEDIIHEKEKAPTWEISKFLKQDFKEPTAYCKGLIYPRGILGIFGQPKSYKTFLVINMALALATGKTFLNFEISAPVKTLILQAELSDGRLQERMSKMTPYYGIPEGKLYIRTIRGAFLNDTKGLAEVSAIIRAIKPEVIIIDPLIEFFTGDENKAQDMNSLFTNLEKLLTDNRSIILVHHLRKPNNNGGDSFSQIRGSSVVYGKLDAGIHISPFVDGQVVLDFTCRNISKPEKFIATIDENLIFRYSKEFGASKVKDSHIIEALKNKGEIPMQELKDTVSEVCECEPETVRKHITRMIKAGTLIKSGGTRNATVKLPE